MKKCLWVLLVWQGSHSAAVPSPAFNARGPNYPIGRMFVSGDNLYVTGDFTAVGKTPAYGVAEWNGREWRALGEGFLKPVTALAFSGSRVFAGGQFGKAGGAQVPYLAQWDGSQWSAVGPAALLKPVLALAYAGGSLFVGVDGNAADSVTGIAAWDGSAWSSLGGGSDSAVRCLKAAGDGVYAGGNFTRIGGVKAAGVARWAQGEWRPLGTGLPGLVSRLEVFGGDLFAAGYFRPGPDTARCNFARWNGSRWACVDVDPGRPSLEPLVEDLAADDRALYATAAVRLSPSVVADQAYRFDGSRWAAMGPATEAGLGVEFTLSACITAYRGEILLAGDFTKVGAKAVPGLARWDGAAWSPWPEGSSGLGLGNRVTELALSGLPTGGGILAAGAFSAAGGSLVNGLGLFDGEGWTDMGFPDSLTLNGGVIAVAAAGGDVFTASYLRNPTGVPREIRIRRLRAGQWASLGEARCENGQTGWGVLLAREGGLYAAGRFDTIDGVPARNIAYWNGIAWQALGSGLNGRCRALEWDGGFLYAGGEFDSAGGTAAHGIARWNGTSWSPLGQAGAEGVKGGSAAYVLAIRKQGDRLVVGGAFSEAGGIPTRNIASWSARGWTGNWEAYRLGVVQDIAARDDSELIVAYANGRREPGDGNSGIVSWSGKGWTPIETRIRSQDGDGALGDGVVWSLALRGNDLYAGGLFNLLGTVPSSHIARWTFSDGAWIRRAAGAGRARSRRALLIGSAARAKARRLPDRSPGALLYDSNGRRAGESHAGE